MITLRGAEVSEKLKAQVQEGLAALGRIPRLAIVRVGDKPDDCLLYTSPSPRD